MQLKSWEKPRDKKRSRNKKGKLASARLRQIKKRNKQLSNKLKQPNNISGNTILPDFFCVMIF